nr:hypothetical protein [uncultured Dongia sp.]
MSSDTLHFLSEAKLAQTANFIETGLASLARLQASAPRGALDAALLAEFADMAEKAGALRQQLAVELQPLLAISGPLVDAGIIPASDTAVQRLVAATQRVLDRLDEMVGRLARLQKQQGGGVDLSVRP